MKKKVQRMLATVTLVLFPLFSASALYAADVDVGNSDTGSGSTNTATASVVQSLYVVIRNDADIDNKVVLDANTGMNTADANTGDGSVTSGDIGGTIDIENEANITDLSTLLPEVISDFPVDVQVSNSQTGANSINMAGFDFANKQKVSVKNNLNVDNKLLADANTGGNSADGNTGDGSVSSGDISFNVAFSTIGNLVNIVLNGVIPDDGGGGVLPDDDGFQGVSPGEFFAAAGAEAVGSLPVAGASGIMWMLILSAFSTVLIVELMNRGKLARLGR